MKRMFIAITLGFIISTAVAAHQTEANRKALHFVPIEQEPAAELFVDPPLPGPLARGAVIIPYRTNHFRILPIFGESATGVSPRAGHLHVSVDDLPWRWADAGDNGAVVVNGLPEGPHKVLIELAMPNHKVIIGKAVTFTIPTSAHEMP